MPFKKNPPAYYVWASMKDRCYNPKCKQYSDYGGRGITVCDRWLSSYRDFYSDMGPRPHGYSLDRIDNDKGYGPDNCRWADRRTQQRNQRRAVYVKIQGEKFRAIELAERAGVKTDTIVLRAQRGLDLATVLSSRRLYFAEGLSLGGAASGAKRRARTHCKYGHEYTNANTLMRPDGARQCRQCHNAKMRRRNAAAKSI